VLAKIAAAPARAIEPAKVAPVDRWTVEASPSDEPSSSPSPPSPLDALTAEVASARKGEVRFTKELTCAARELGRFYLEKKAFPDERLRRFMTARCGAIAPDIGMAVQGGEVPAQVPDAEVVAKWGDGLKKTLVEKLEGSRRVAGAWLARREGEAVVMLAYGSDETDLSISEVSDGSDEVLVSGVLHRPAERLVGLLNQGEQGVASCQRDWAIDLPRYAFRCALAPEDKAAWFELSAQEAGRVLGRSVALTLVRRSRDVAREYVQSARPPVPVKAQGDLAKAVIDAVNQTRAAAKLPGLRLAVEQSRTADKLAPHFFGSEGVGDRATTEQIALGLLAGWDIKGGVIQEGLFLGGLLAKSQNASEWVEFALERPIGRLVLLSPGAQEIAIGAADVGAVDGLAALITTYSFFGSADHNAEKTRLLQRLRDHRAARRLPQARFITGLTNLAAQARLVHEGKKDPGEALRAALEGESAVMERAMRGFAFEGTNLDTIRFPDELMKPEPLFVGIEITHHRAPGAAWGQYVVFVLMVDEPVVVNAAASGAQVVRY
jgi:hypothetical protein